MSTAEDAAIRTATAFIAAFNAQDHDALADTLNYPHIRLANGAFHIIDTRQAFVERSRRGQSLLAAEGWDHTVMRSIEAVHSGPDKVHLALQIDRCNRAGSVYNQFETLWIATLQNGHWGIQFRSSYLLAPR